VIVIAAIIGLLFYLKKKGKLDNIFVGNSGGGKTTNRPEPYVNKIKDDQSASMSNLDSDGKSFNTTDGSYQESDLLSDSGNVSVSGSGASGDGDVSLKDDNGSGDNGSGDVNSSDVSGS